MVIVIMAIVVFSLLSFVVKIAREYERGIIFRLGRLLRAKGPGVILLIPIVDRMIKMGPRVVTLDVPRQEMMTKDNVPVTVDAVVYFRVVNPEDAVVKVANFSRATSFGIISARLTAEPRLINDACPQPTPKHLRGLFSHHVVPSKRLQAATPACLAEGDAHVGVRAALRTQLNASFPPGAPGSSSGARSPDVETCRGSASRRRCRSSYRAA